MPEWQGTIYVRSDKEALDHPRFVWDQDSIVWDHNQSILTGLDSATGGAAVTIRVILSIGNHKRYL